MKRIAAYLIWISLGSAPLWAMPSQITFQGTLKQKGIPVNTTKNMQFSFVDGSGGTITGTTPISVANVQVTNGLFAVQLPIDPSIPWEQYSPFIRVSVEGQILSPDQPLNANLYAVAAIPQGMIAMFAASCPNGWTSFAPLNNNNAFPMGGTVYDGTLRGSVTHSHRLSDSGVSIFGQPGFSAGIATLGGPGSDGALVAAAGGGVPAQQKLSTTDAANNLPPYITIVYCQKI